MSYANRHPAEAREHLRQRDGGNCWLCEEPIDFSLPPQHPKGATLEHVIPKAAGGTNHLSNLRLSHAQCNHSRGAEYNGRQYGRQDSPYGIGKHYRRKSQRTYRRDISADASDWDTPVLDCWPLFESWSAARP